MGYRSDVAILCHEKAFEKLRDAWNENEFYPDWIYKQPDTFLVQWDDVKWYSDFPEVRAIETTLSYLDDFGEDPQFQYRYVRIGEDTDDNEERGNGWLYDIYVSRRIAIEGDIGENVTTDLAKKLAPVKKCNAPEII